MKFSLERRERGTPYEEEVDQDGSRTNGAVSSWPPAQAKTGAAVADASIKKEHMFEKVVTPSDVGKLNRLVIPKLHAEKHFPLHPSSGSKGLLLSFQDQPGNLWRFRYSYWNSSQSYVMTKGWSRFVKEKRLDAGDTVSFSRISAGHDSGSGRLFIDFRRRHPAFNGIYQRPLFAGDRTSMPFMQARSPWAAGFFNSPFTAYNNEGRQICFEKAARGPPLGGGHLAAAGTASMPAVLESVPVVHGMAKTKRFRLFGVNLDCTESSGDAVGHLELPNSTPRAFPMAGSRRTASE